MENSLAKPVALMYICLYACMHFFFFVIMEIFYQIKSYMGACCTKQVIDEVSAPSRVSWRGENRVLLASSPPLSAFSLEEATGTYVGNPSMPWGLRKPLVLRSPTITNPIRHDLKRFSNINCYSHEPHSPQYFTPVTWVLMQTFCCT